MDSLATNGIIKLDDVSPQIIYGPEGEWFEADPRETATWAEAYMDGTFHQTVTEHAFASVIFNGTGVAAYGALRENHCAYQVYLDTRLVDQKDGYAPYPFQFQQVLYEVQNLSPGRHNLTLVHRPSLTDPSNPAKDLDTHWLDIDYFLVNQHVPFNPSENLSKTYNSDPFRYTGDWTSQASSQHVNGWVRRSTSSGDTASLTFTGQRIQVFGDTGLRYADYRVQIDGASEMTFSANASRSYSQVPLFSAGMLSNTTHTITITNLGGEDNTLDIDYAVVNYTLGHGRSGGGYVVRSSRSSLLPSSSSSQRSTSASAIVTDSQRVLGSQSEVSGSSTGPRFPTTSLGQNPISGSDATNESSALSRSSPEIWAPILALALILLAAIIGFVWFRRSKRRRQAESQAGLINAWSEGGSNEFVYSYYPPSDASFTKTAAYTTAGAKETIPSDWPSQTIPNTISSPSQAPTRSQMTQSMASSELSFGTSLPYLSRLAVPPSRNTAATTASTEIGTRELLSSTATPSGTQVTTRETLPTTSNLSITHPATRDILPQLDTTSYGLSGNPLNPFSHPRFTPPWDRPVRGFVPTSVTSWAQTADSSPWTAIGTDREFIVGSRPTQGE